MSLYADNSWYIGSDFTAHQSQVDMPQFCIFVDYSTKNTMSRLYSVFRYPPNCGFIL